MQIYVCQHQNNGWNAIPHNNVRNAKNYVLRDLSAHDNAEIQMLECRDKIENGSIVAMFRKGASALLD